MSDTDWRHTPEPEPVLKDRVQLQRDLDLDYGLGRITQEEWSKQFDILSDPDWHEKRLLSIQMLKRAATTKKSG